MKNSTYGFIVIFTFCAALAAISFIVGYHQGKKAPTVVVSYGWDPKAGDRVATVLQSDGSVGDLRIVTITNVVRVGRERCQTGLLVYTDDIHGVDSSWVKPAPFDAYTRSNWTTNEGFVSQETNYFTGKPFTESALTKDKIIAAYTARLYRDAFNRGVTNGASCAIILCKSNHCNLSEDEASGIIMQAVGLMTRHAPEWPYDEWPELRTNWNTDWIGGYPHISPPQTNPEHLTH